METNAITTTPAPEPTLVQRFRMIYETAQPALTASPRALDAAALLKSDLLRAITMLEKGQFHRLLGTLCGQGPQDQQVCASFRAHVAASDLDLDDWIALRDVVSGSAHAPDPAESSASLPKGIGGAQNDGEFSNVRGFIAMYLDPESVLPDHVKLALRCKIDHNHRGMWAYHPADKITSVRFDAAHGVVVIETAHEAEEYNISVVLMNAGESDEG